MQPSAVAEIASATRTPLPSRHVSKRAALQAAIDVWPAAGGGLLVSLDIAALRASPRRTGSNLSGFFLKICAWNAHAVTIPYVTLDTRMSDCLIDLMSDELDLPSASIQLTDGGNRSVAPRVLTSKEFLQAEWHFRAAASAAKDLILAEAAYVWRAVRQDCVLRGGLVTNAHDDCVAPISAFASGAALRSLGNATELRCGRRIGLRSPRATATGFAQLKNGWLAASEQ